MWRELKVMPEFGVILAVLVAAPTLVTSTRQYGTDALATENVPEVNFGDITSGEDDTVAGRAWAWVRAVAEGPWLALLLPLLVGLGLLQATLFHAAALHVIGALKSRPERWRLRRWRATAAGALGAAAGAQVVLLAGMVLVALRAHRAMQQGTFASAQGFGAFYPGHQVWEPLQPFLWAIPVLFLCYWAMLDIMCKLEEKKKRRKAEQTEELVLERPPDISIIKITKL